MATKTKVPRHPKKTITRKAKPEAHLSAQELSSYPFRCANCASLIEEVRMFCSQLCQQEAEWVRYARRCRADGRDQKPDVRLAIKIKLAHVLSGGYDRIVRAIPDSLRDEIFERDKGQCQVCGQPGNEIDHISGDEPAPANLQLLCKTCHMEKTARSMVRISREADPELWEKAKTLMSRAVAKQPLRLCDSENWAELQRDLMKIRRAYRSARHVDG